MKNRVLILALIAGLSTAVYAEENYMQVHTGGVEKIYSVSDIDSISFNNLNDTLMMLLQPRKYFRIYINYQSIYEAENGKNSPNLESLGIDLKKTLDSDSLFSYSMIDSVSFEASLKKRYRTFPVGTIIGLKIYDQTIENIKYYVKGTSNDEAINLYLYKYDIYGN